MSQNASTAELVSAVPNEAREQTLRRALELVDPGSLRAPFLLPHIPRLKQVPQRIDADDEAEIRWRLVNPVIASLAEMGSGFGLQLERAESFGFGAVPCKRCGGRWRVKRSARDGEEYFPEADWQGGRGWMPKDRFGKRISYATAYAEHLVVMKRVHKIVIIDRPKPKPGAGFTAEQVWSALAEHHKARGETLMTEQELREYFPDLPEEGCEPCDACDGLGIVPRRTPWHAPITAFPTGSSKEPASGSVRDDAATLMRKAALGGPMADATTVLEWGMLARWFAVERLLADVAGIAPIARLALEGFYRPQTLEEQDYATRFHECSSLLNSNRTAQPHGWAALNELTPSARSPEAADSPRHGVWRAERDAEAAKLYDFACAAWNLTAYGGPS
jgi:hypothetical protein